MNASEYQSQIPRLDRARDLHSLNADIVADETLTSDEKTALGEIKQRFGQLNRLVNPNLKPRWI